MLTELNYWGRRAARHPLNEEEMSGVARGG